MNRTNFKISYFNNSGLIIGFVSVVLIVLIVLLFTYFFDKDNTEYKEIEFGVVLENTKYYSQSDFAGWHTINAGLFKIQTPKDYKLFRLQGIDSFVGGLTNQKDTLQFDIGSYSQPLNNLSSIDFITSYESINEIKFRIVRSVDESKYFAAYTEDLTDENKFTIECSNCIDIKEKYTMIRTIEFKNSPDSPNQN